MAGITVSSIDELTDSKFSLNEFLDKIMSTDQEKADFEKQCIALEVTSSRPLIEWMNLFSFGLDYEKKD